MFSSAISPPITEAYSRGNKKITIGTIGVAHLRPIVSSLARILILIVPRLLNYIVAIFFDRLWDLGTRAGSMIQI
jgi:Protein of unknown function (DUF3096)